MKITRYADIPQFTRSASYSIDVSWAYIEKTLDMMAEGGGIDLDPDFQRAHVWTEAQQIRYVEFCLRGGKSSRDILWNCPTWQSRESNYDTDQPVVLVDGKQRLQAVRRFMANEVPAFGSFRREYDERMRIDSRFKFHVNDLQTRAEVLQHYLDFNAGGIAHTDAEIAKVRKLLEAEKAKVDA